MVKNQCFHRLFLPFSSLISVILFDRQPDFKPSPGKNRKFIAAFPGRKLQVQVGHPAVENWGFR
ncbi:hypothetical protein NE546_17270, partial [Neglectibacter timonensis]|nr:hypothetical protein [Neglectibacter timonensis]